MGHIHIPWTKGERGEEDVLKKLLEKGSSLDQIRAVFPGRSVDSIRSKISSMGLGLSPRAPKINLDLFDQIMAGGEVEKG